MSNWKCMWMAAAVVLAGGLFGPAAAQAARRSCGWQVQFTPNALNAAFPDEGANYWLAVLPVPPGGHLELDGQFPHARYTSLITYSLQTQAIDGINDTAIQPDPGSSNPLAAGASRTVAQRSYTVRVVNGRIPQAGRAVNTVYTENADGSKSTRALNVAVLGLRIYAPDRGTDVDAGVPLPTISLVTASGQKTKLPECPDLLPATGLTQAVAGAGLDLPTRAAGPTPVWRKYTNLATLELNVQADGTPLAPALTPTTDKALPNGGLFENIDNKYVYAQTEARFGQVFVMHARAPSTPHTLAGEPVMGTGQLRYWSMCTENGQTTQFYGCANDENVPVDENGDYTIVVSTAAARPSNAQPACGVAWLPAGPALRTLLLLRNMLPDPGFAQAIQNITPGREQQGMGAYYPGGRYYATKAAYQATGCHPAAAPTLRAGCPAASGHLSGRSLGPVTLGMTRARARRVLAANTRHSTRNLDVFCLDEGRLRVGYASSKALRGRVALIMSSHPLYELDGAHPGAPAAAVARRLGVRQHFTTRADTWYVLGGRGTPRVLRSRHGVIQEVGIVDRRLVRSRAAAARLIKSIF